VEKRVVICERGRQPYCGKHGNMFAVIEQPRLGEVWLIPYVADPGGYLRHIRRGGESLRIYQGSARHLKRQFGADEVEWRYNLRFPVEKGESHGPDK